MNNDCETRFACCKVNWNIENFCFVHPLDDWSVFSSVFILQGLKSVKWRLSLELQKCSLIEAGETIKAEETTKTGETSKNGSDDKQGIVSVFLEKLPISQANNAKFSVCVNWEIKLTAGCKEFGPYERKIEFGDDCKHGQIGIATTKEILEHLFPFEPDTIVISLYFVAFDKNKSFESKDKLSRGLFLLSEDLKRLKDIEKNYTDVMLKVNDEYIRAHKVILCLNSRFCLYLNEAQNDIIEIPNFDYNVLNAFVNCLYSGNVDYCLENISISMIRCMEHFECDNLQPYYIPEEIAMNSKIKVETHDFQWFVTDILGRDYFEIQSPFIRRLHDRTIWHLNISLKSDDPENLISIFAHITNGNKPEHFCLEFALMRGDFDEEKYFCRRLVKHIPNDSDGNSYENLGFKDFFRKEEIFNYTSWHFADCVCFLFRVRTSDCSQESSIGCHSMSFVLPIKSKSCKNISEKMSELLENELYCDIVVKLKSNEIIKAHKCILIARSPGFRRKIESELSDNNTLIMSDIECEIVKLSIRYLYKGSFDDEMKGAMIGLYYNSLPDKFDIPSLNEESLKYLQDMGTYVIPNTN